jgi:ubiquinone/menaquinone biosynthesis C-methylase UbiE
MVHASGESVPLPDASFDIAFCDHGAMTFADPYKTGPEVARLLRDSGLLAFNMTSPPRMLVAEDPRTDRPNHPTRTFVFRFAPLCA